MRNPTLFILILLSFISTATLATNPGAEFEIPVGQLSFNKACDLVLENNPGIQEVTSRLEAAMATLTQSRSTLWPWVSGSASAFGQDITMCPDWEPTTRWSVDLIEYSAGLQAHWTVFNGFARRARILAAEAQVDGVTWQVQEAYRLLLEAVATTFYQTHLARERMIIAVQNRSFNQELKDNAIKRWKVGDVPESDVLTFSVNALQAEVEYRTALRDYNLICTALARLLALPDSLLPQNMHPLENVHIPQSIKRDFKTELDYALAHRPDLKALDCNSTALENQLTIARSTYWPKIDASAGFSYNFYDDPDTVDQEEHNAYVGITTSFDLFSGFRRNGQIKEVEANIRGLQYARKNKILSIESDIRSRILELEAAIDILNKHQLAYDQTLKIRNYIERAYIAGEASITRLNEAQTNLVAISGQLAASKLMILLSDAKLNIASGRILD